VLTVQPEVLESIQDKPGFRGRGLLARFMFIIPEDPRGRRKVGVPAVPPEINARYERLIHGLLDLPAGLTLTPSDEASKLNLDFQRRLEARLAPGADLRHLADWASKAAGASVRIAGIMHTAELIDADLDSLEITGTTMANAIILVEKFFLHHALMAIGTVGNSPELDAAQQVVDWARARPSPMTHFTAREVHRSLRRRRQFSNAADVQTAIDTARKHGHLRRIEASNPKKGASYVLREEKISS
jgi:hypothetical protein